MSWRENLGSYSDRVQLNRFSSFAEDYGEPMAEILPLLSQIGDRDVVVDACLPPQLANDLRKNNVNAIWVPAILGDGASDGEIERQLLRGKWSQRWGGSDKEKVLLTRDVEFYKRIRGRAILVSYRVSNSASTKMQSNEMIRRELKKIIRRENTRS
jgi:predicted nuclease of predicted toxin-antitoxin system